MLRIFGFISLLQEKKKKTDDAVMTLSAHPHQRKTQIKSVAQQKKTLSSCRGSGDFDKTVHRDIEVGDG